MVIHTQIEFNTTGYHDVRDLTPLVRNEIARFGIQNGLVNIFVIGSTGAVGTIEFEPGLCKDLPEMLDRLIPPAHSYAHEATWHDGNGHSHLQATLLGPSITVPIKNGKLILGTWQQIFFIECDIRPRKRTVLLTMIGD